MVRKRVSIALLIVFAVCFISSSISTGYGWTDSELTSNPGTAPTIDGIKDNSWIEANQSYHTFSGNRQIVLYVQHSGNNLYFLVEVKFVTTNINETISLYISNTTSTAESNFLDKKQITMYKASESGNQTVETFDLYRNSTDVYLPDVMDSGFSGAANISNNNFRYYEFKVEFNPESGAELEDTSILILNKIAIKIAINNTITGEEKSEALLIQVGPEVDLSQDNIGVFNVDMKTYIQIVMIIVLIVVIAIGITIVGYRIKSQPINEEELEMYKKPMEEED